MAISTRTYQSSDLTTTRRREFLNDASTGVARIRLPEGTTLVTLPEEVLDVLTQLRTHTLGLLALQNAVSRERSQRRTTDFGELAWASALDDVDLSEFVGELVDSLAVSLADSSVTRVDETLNAWRETAHLLGDTHAMRLVNSRAVDEWIEVEEPSQASAAESD